MKTNLFFFLSLMFSYWIFGQRQSYSIGFAKDRLEYIIETSEIKNDFVIPIDIKTVNTNSDAWKNIEANVEVIGGGMTELASNEYSLNVKKIPLNDLSQFYTIYLRVNSGSVIKDNEKIVLQFNVKNNVTGQEKNDLNAGENKIIQIIFKNKKNNNEQVDSEKAISLNDYTNRKNGLELDEVIKVESLDNNNILSISGYDHDNRYAKRKVILERNEVLPVPSKSYIFTSIHWKPIPISVITVPFKVRPKIELDGQGINSLATSGVTNIGLNLDLGKYQLDRYFASGKKSSHKFSLGFWAAPSVEELDSLSTRGYGNLVKGKTSKQMFISTGITVSYSYNDVSFVFVPLGWDFGTSAIGKNWIYNKRRWWGFGIAISPKVFATIFNK